MTSFALTRHGQSTDTPRGARVGRFIANHDSPGPDLPSGHKSPDNIGVVSGEIFGDRAFGRAEDEECPVCRVGECPFQEELPAAAGLPQEPEMFLPVRGPARHEIVDHIVEQCIVVHVITSPGLWAYRTAPSRLVPFQEPDFRTSRTHAFPIPRPMIPVRTLRNCPKLFQNLGSLPLNFS